VPRNYSLLADEHPVGFIKSFIGCELMIAVVLCVTVYDLFPGLREILISERPGNYEQIQVTIISNGDKVFEENIIIPI
jgi:hypothetical protein